MTILERPLHATRDDDRTIDLVRDHPELPGDHGDDPEDAEGRDETPTDDAGTPEAAPARRPARQVVRGMRVRRLRLRSVAAIAAVFFTLGYLTVVATLVVLWNAAQSFGFVDTVEETVTTSLGLETFTLDGQDLFEIVVVAGGLLALLGLLVTVLLAFVYNAAGALFGGLALETEPLRRHRRVFSFRERRFVTIRA